MSYGFANCQWPIANSCECFNELLVFGFLLNVHEVLPIAHCQLMGE
jgi:hypothetical protein